jgi:hypothetical protein
LNWHINQPHTESAVEYGTLSTLRQSLSSLVAGNQRDEKATNNFIDALIVEYFPIKSQIKSLEAKEYLESNEILEMDKYILILNIKDNKRQEIKGFKKELNKLRTASKMKIQLHGRFVETGQLYMASPPKAYMRRKGRI